MRSKVLEKGAGNGGEEVHVGRGVEALGEIARDRLDIGRSRFHQVDNGDVGNGISLRIKAPRNRATVSGPVDT